MPRDKVFTLFNRNQIRVTKTVHEKAFGEIESFISSSGSLGSYSSEYARSVFGWKRFGWSEKEVTKESPLGFYYKKKVQEHISDDKSLTHATGLRYKTFTVRYSNTTITIRYPFENVRSADKTVLDREHYSWELCGSGMPEHFIKDLYETINRLTGDLPSAVYKKAKSNIETVLMDLFRSKDGITNVYTDEMKIAAHGFDPKLSFRKEKENNIKK